MLRMTAMGCGLFACLLTALPAAAQDDEPAPPPVRPLFDQGRLLATGGVAQVEGAGGGGLAAWALIAGYGTDNGMGLRGHATTVVLPDYRLTTLGVSTGLFDRVELSYAWMEFDTLGVGAALGLGQGFTFHQHVFGAKLRLFGDAIYDQDGWLPQVSVGLQHKQNDRGAVIAFIGGKSDTGTDYYLAASKLFLAESLLVNATVRATRANQLGILGFGGDKHSGYSAQFEGSVAYLLDRTFAIGAEFRTRPSNLSIAREGSAHDLFAAWFPNKNISFTLAYADLGNIVIRDDQRGLYFSVQAGI
jgi:hypothetical protein